MTSLLVANASWMVGAFRTILQHLLPLVRQYNFLKSTKSQRQFALTTCTANEADVSNVCSAVTLRTRLLQVAKAVKSVLRFGCAVFPFFLWMLLLLIPVISNIHLKNLGITPSEGLTFLTYTIPFVIAKLMDIYDLDLWVIKRLMGTLFEIE